MTTNPSLGKHASDGSLISEFAGDPDMAELVRLFVEEMPERIESIMQTWERAAAGDLRRLAHQMKGACGGYGFPQVGQAAGVLESSLAAIGQTADAGDLEGLRQQLDELVGLCRRVTADPESRK